MILDSIINAPLYFGLSENIKIALQYIMEVKSDIALGEYILSENVKAIISEYLTKEIFERGYEAHKHVIDIQYPIIGRERIKWSNLSGMDLNIGYDPEKDRAFYKNSIENTHVDVGNGFFAIFFPDDAHSPQHFIDKPELIKKVTMKVHFSNLSNPQ